MGKHQPKYREIKVRNIDGTWGKLNTVDCRTVRGFDTPNGLSVYLHKTKNSRWYEEKYDHSRERGQGIELSLDHALDWLVCYSDPNIENIVSLGELEDVCGTSIPRHGGDIVVKCIECRRRERQLDDRSGSKKRLAILRVLTEAECGLSGKEIASRARVKNDSGLRTILAALVQEGRVVKFYHGEGYALKAKPSRRKMS